MVNNSILWWCLILTVGGWLYTFARFVAAFVVLGLKAPEKADDFENTLLEIAIDMAYTGEDQYLQPIYAMLDKYVIMWLIAWPVILLVYDVSIRPRLNRMAQPKEKKDER